MSTRHTIPTTFALVGVGQTFATAVDATPTHRKASSVHARHLGVPFTATGHPLDAPKAEAFEPDARVYVTTLASRLFDVVLVRTDGGTSAGAWDVSTHEEALSHAHDTLLGMFHGRGPRAVAAVVIDRDQPDEALRTRVFDLRAVRPHQCDEGCWLCDRCMTALGASRCARTCPHADEDVAAVPADDAVVPKYVGRRSDTADGRAFEVVEVRERVVEAGFFTLRGAQEAAIERNRAARAAGGAK